MTVTPSRPPRTVIHSIRRSLRSGSGRPGGSAADGGARTCAPPKGSTVISPRRAPRGPSLLLLLLSRGTRIRSHTLPTGDDGEAEAEARSRPCAARVVVQVAVVGWFDPGRPIRGDRRTTGSRCPPPPAVQKSSSPCSAAVQPCRQAEPEASQPCHAVRSPFCTCIIRVVRSTPYFVLGKSFVLGCWSSSSTE